MTPKEAADKLRPHFHLHAMPPDARHHVAFVEQIADELGIDKTPFNLHQVAEALDREGIEGDSLQYPMMLYSRRHHAVAGIEPSVYLPRHDAVAVHVANEEQAKELGEGWIESLDHLPPRGETPLNAPAPIGAPAADADGDLAV